MASLHGKRAAGPWPPCLAQKRGASLGAARRQREREAGMRSSYPHPRQSLAPAPATALLLMCLQPSLAREGLPSPLISSAPVLSPSHHQPPHTAQPARAVVCSASLSPRGAHTPALGQECLSLSLTSLGPTCPPVSLCPHSMSYDSCLLCAQRSALSCAARWPMSMAHSRVCVAAPA